MRFIVDAYRVILLGLLALALIGGSYFLFSARLADGPSGQYGGLALIWFLVSAMVVILTIGATATFISIHDRLAEIADHSRRIADAMERDGPMPREG